jgi:AcrR family transcriptional regulator
VAAVKSRRPYRSHLRAEQAAQTRRRILEASGELFTERGYIATTIEAVAEKAGVAVDTVYAIFGNKRAMLSAVVDFRVTGSTEGSDVLAGEEPQALRQLTDQRQIITGFATDISRRVERVRPIDDVLRGAAASDPDINDLRARMQENRFAKMGEFIGWLASKGPLRNDMDIDTATATTWTLTSPEVNRMLRDVRGWSAERYVEWLSTTLARVLLP